MECQYIYNDANGNPSAIYARALEKYGPERAEQIYMKHMLDTIDTRYSRTADGKPFEQIDEKSTKLHPQGDSTNEKDPKNIYAEDGTNNRYARVTWLLSQWYGEDQNTKFANIFINPGKDSFAIGRSKQATLYLRNRMAVQAKNANMDVDSYIKHVISTTTPDLQNRAERDIQTYWDTNNKTGNEFHAAAAEIARQWNSMYDEQAPNENGIRPSLNIRNLPEAISRAKLVMGDNWNNEDGFEKFKPAELDKCLRDVYSRILEKERVLGKHLILKPELSIASDKLKVQGTAYSGIAGTIDLLMCTPDKSYAATLDYKTKSAEKVIDFDKLNGTYINGPFEKMDNTAENRAKIQQWLYAAILKDNGIDVRDTMTAIIPINYGESSSPIGEKTYHVSSLKEAEIAGLPREGTPKPKPGSMEYSRQTGFEKVGEKANLIQLHFRVGNIPEYYDNARKLGISGITEKWSGENADDQPQATFTRISPEPYIKRKLTQVYTDKKTGNQVVDFFGKKLVVEGMNNEERSELLRTEYGVRKQAETNIGKDIINYFYHRDLDRIPFNIKGSMPAINAMLQGFDPMTHDIELAQELMPELHGVGPDVLVVTNNLTGAISLLDAVTAKKAKLKFESDGSKINARTSLVGKYMTDKDIQSGSLAEKLMTEPTTHDILAMKLGLTALYLKQRAGTDISIDRMRVATISPDNVYHITHTSPEEELEKLSLFSKVAGDDFPDEYRKLIQDDSKNTNYIISEGKHLEHLMKQIKDNTDPLGTYYSRDVRNNLVMQYNDWTSDKFVSTDLKQALGKYLEAVSNRLRPGKTDAQVLQDPRFVAVSRAFMEYQKFEDNMATLAAKRIALPAVKSLVTSADKIQVHLSVQYNEASARIRHDMNAYQKEHNALLDKLFKSKGISIGNTTKAFADMFNDASADPSLRMTLKQEGTPEFNALSDIEQQYIKFFNENTKSALLKVSPARFSKEIEDGNFWSEGTVPVVRQNTNLVTMDNLKSWTKLKAGVEHYLKLDQKLDPSGVKTVTQWGYHTNFDTQAADSNVGHSEMRRRALGLGDLSAPKPMDENIETNLAHVLNLSQLEASKKENFSMLIQTVNAMNSILAFEDDEIHTRLTRDMINLWKDKVLLNKTSEGVNPVLTKSLDAANRISSMTTFAFSIRQAMTGATVGTIQHASSLISQTIQSAVEKYMFSDEGSTVRFTPKEWAKAATVWNLWDHKYEQMIYDAGMIQTGPVDLQTGKFNGEGKAQVFKSESAYYLNKLFFNQSVAHTFMAAAMHQGFDQAYVPDSEAENASWHYDETLDPRFFAYDPENKIGDRAPITDEEKQKFALWTAVRKTMDQEGQMDKDTKRLYQPLTANERAELKNYTTRLYGSFSKDEIVHGEGQAFGRAMLRYKKWATQQVANYWTPTVKADMYGHWETVTDPETGEYHSDWVGDDFQGIIQTLSHMAREFTRTRDTAFLKDLNRYQRENISKLSSDLLVSCMLLILALPLIHDQKKILDPNTGKEITQTGDFGKSVFGDSAYKAAMNATTHMAFVLSMPHMATSIFPGLSTLGNLASTAFKGIGVAVTDQPLTGHYAIQTIRGTGLGRTALSGIEGFHTVANILQ